MTYLCREGTDCLPVLILNKLLKMLDAQNYQNAGNAVLEYATSTRNFGRIAFALGSSRSTLRPSGLQFCMACCQQLSVWCIDQFQRYSSMIAKSQGASGRTSPLATRFLSNRLVPAA